MTFFREIIFPPKPKSKIIVVQPTEEKNSYDFDCWIIGATADTKTLWVKCPICYHTYELENVINQTTTKFNLREYEPFYYRKIIRHCPNGSSHLEKVCQSISNK